VPFRLKDRRLPLPQTRTSTGSSFGPAMTKKEMRMAHENVDDGRVLILRFGE
jgi:hypothetical protein